MQINMSKRFALVLITFVVCLFALSAALSSVGACTFPCVVSCDASGNEKKEFGFSEHVFAKGSGYSPNEDLMIYVVVYTAPCHKNWAVRSVSAKADGSGFLKPTDLGTFAVGKYNVWVDRNGDGWRNPGEPVYEWCAYGFFVVPEFWLGTIMGLAGCFGALGVFRISKREHK
ncbi:MAG: hypothetical protein QW667_03420 [Candidatus Bathyarchaeia archaeon]